MSSSLSKDLYGFNSIDWENAEKKKPNSSIRSASALDFDDVIVHETKDDKGKRHKKNRSLDLPPLPADLEARTTAALLIDLKTPRRSSNADHHPPVPASSAVPTAGVSSSPRTGSPRTQFGTNFSPRTFTSVTGNSPRSALSSPRTGVAGASNSGISPRLLGTPRQNSPRTMSPRFTDVQTSPR